jgi:hypothetical protein
MSYIITSGAADTVYMYFGTQDKISRGQRHKKRKTRKKKGGESRKDESEM